MVLCFALLCLAGAGPGRADRVFLHAWRVFGARASVRCQSELCGLGTWALSTTQVLLVGRYYDDYENVIFCLMNEIFDGDASWPACPDLSTVMSSQLIVDMQAGPRLL